jgi:hypothetical protein
MRICRSFPGADSIRNVTAAGFDFINRLRSNGKTRAISLRMRRFGRYRP